MQRWVIGLAVLVVLTAGMAQAASLAWSTTLPDADWSIPTNWGGTEPSSGDDAYIYNGGTAYVTQSGEVCNDLYVGTSSGGITGMGMVQMTGGSLSDSNVYLGHLGIGTFTQTGGTHTVTNTLVMNMNSGIYNLSGTGQLIAGYETIGLPIGGTFNHSAGTNTVINGLLLNSQYNLSGTGQLVARYELINNNGTSSGTLNQSSGTNTTDSLNVGNSSGINGNGTYNLSGTGQLTTNNETVGHYATGTFTQTGGIHTADTLNLGDYGNGTYNLSGTGQLTTSYERIGYDGTGTFIQTGGTHTVTGTFNLNAGLSDGNGTYNLSGTGQLTVANENIALNDGMATFTQTGGTHTIQGNLVLGSQGIYNLTGGTLILNAISQVSAGNFNFGGGTLQLSNNSSITLPMTLTGTGGNANIDTAGNVVTLAGQLSGTGGLNKVGENTLILSTTNTYSGTTSISGGTLKVNNTTGSGTGSGTVVVNAGGKLSGSGIISGPVLVNSGGVLAPGNSPGILTVNNQVTFLSGSSFNVDVNGLKVGEEYDQLTTTGPVRLAGSINFNIGSFMPTGHDVLFLINNTSSWPTTGKFQYADNAYVDNFNGYDWYITYDADNTDIPSLTGGNDVAIYSEPVPEPSTIIIWSLLGTVGITIGWWRRKRAA